MLRCYARVDWQLPRSGISPSSGTVHNDATYTAPVPWTPSQPRYSLPVVTSASPRAATNEQSGVKREDPREVWGMMLGTVELEEQQLIFICFSEDIAQSYLATAALGHNCSRKSFRSRAHLNMDDDLVLNLELDAGPVSKGGAAKKGGRWTDRYAPSPGLLSRTAFTSIAASRQSVWRNGRRDHRRLLQLNDL